MAIEDQVINDHNNIDDIVRGGLKQPSSIPSLDYQSGFTPSKPARQTTIGGSRASEAPLSDFQKSASSIASGLKAGEVGSGQPVYDNTEAAVSIGAATAAGAAGGAIAGGPVGAILGAGAGAISGSVNAWLSLRASKRQRSQMRAIQQEARERQLKEDAMTAEEKEYNRSREAKSGAADAYFKTVSQLERLSTNDSNLKDLFVKRGF